MVHPPARDGKHSARRVRQDESPTSRRCIRRSSSRSAPCSPRDRRRRLFRRGVDPIHLYISIAGVSYFYFSNIHTLSVIFDVPLESDSEMAARRSHVEEVIMGYLRA